MTDKGPSTHARVSIRILLLLAIVTFISPSGFLSAEDGTPISFVARTRIPENKEITFSLYQGDELQTGRAALFFPYPNQKGLQKTPVHKFLRGLNFSTITTSFQFTRFSPEDPKTSYYFPKTGTGDAYLAAWRSLCRAMGAKITPKNVKFWVIGESGGASAAAQFACEYPRDCYGVVIAGGRVFPEVVPDSVAGMPWLIIHTRNDFTVENETEIFVQKLIEKGSRVLYVTTPPIWTGRKNRKSLYYHCQNPDSYNLQNEFIAEVSSSGFEFDESGDEMPVQFSTVPCKNWYSKSRRIMAALDNIPPIQKASGHQVTQFSTAASTKPIGSVLYLHDDSISDLGVRFDMLYLSTRGYKGSVIKLSDEPSIQIPDISDKMDSDGPRYVIVRAGIPRASPSTGLTELLQKKDRVDAIFLWAVDFNLRMNLAREFSRILPEVPLLICEDSESDTGGNIAELQKYISETPRANSRPISRNSGKGSFSWNSFEEETLNDILILSAVKFFGEFPK